MPSKKRTAANLGHWAQPGSRKKKTQHQPAADVPLPESPELPDTHPVDDEEPVLDSASSIDLGTVSTLSVDDDLLPPKGSIARWLGSSCDKLQKLFDNPSTAEPNSRARGKYAVKGVEEPALRTKQLHAKIKRDHEQKFGVSPMLKFLKAKLPHAIDVDKPDETELESTAFDGEDFAPEHPGATSQYRLQAVRDIVNNGTADDIEQARDSLWAGPWATWVTLDAGGEDYGLGRPGELEVEHAQAPNRAAASAPLLGRPSVSFTSELEPRPTRPVVPRVACDARLPGGHGCVGDSNEQLPMHLATWGVSSPFVTTRAREELTLGDGAEMLHASRGQPDCEHAPSTPAASSAPSTTLSGPSPSRPSLTTAGSRSFVPPPTQAESDDCLAHIISIIHPRRDKGPGHKPVAVQNEVLHTRLQLMAVFLRLYWQAGYTRWIASSEVAASTVEKGPWLAE